MRGDETWVREVADDPAAQAGINEFGIPLSPAELADIRSRRWDEDLLLRARGYCLSVPEDCAGTYINLKGSGVIVDIAHEVERHRTILTNLVADSALITVHDVEWSMKELEGFIPRVEAEEAWFATIGVEFIQVMRGITNNFLTVDFKGPSKVASAAIEAHFGSPTWLKARWVGPPAWDGPRADLVVRVLESDGRPGVDIRCDVRPEDPLADEGFADFVFGTGRAGVCDMKNLPAVAYRIRLFRWVDNDHEERISIDDIRVVLTPPGKVVEVVVPRS